MMLRILSLFILSSMSVSEAGLWKSSLDFHLNNKSFSYISSFHRGLSDAAQKKVEDDTPLVRYVSSLPREERTQNLAYDNIGNVFFENRELHYDNGFRAPINSENIAYASLQVIFDDSSAQFVHITDTVGGRKQQQVRYFSSSTHDSVFSREARDRLNLKKDANLASKPNSFNTDDFDLYHPNAHSEDKIYYELSRHYRKYLDKAWGRKPNGTSKIIGVVLHLHTRFDMCGSCAYALDWELNDPQGFGQAILEYCYRLNASRTLTHFSTLVSSRQGFLVWGKERRTLPEGPPLISEPGDYQADYGVYRRQIDLASDLSVPKKFAQSVVPAFLPPITGNDVYEFAKDSEAGAMLKVSSVSHST